MKSEAIEYSDLLSSLVGLQGEVVVASMRGASDNPPLFLFFESTLVRGWDGNMGNQLGHDEETIELDFENGVTFAIDPSHVTRAFRNENDNGSQTLEFLLGRVIVKLTRDAPDLNSLSD
jgi:hypothetical protein